MGNPYKNRTVKENSFETVPDGDYEVNGIADFFSLDDRELPVFKPQGDNIVAQFHLRKVDGSVGPAMSATRNQLNMMARAFGASVEGLPEGETTGYLLEVQERINKSAQKQTANVSGGKGWAKYVTGSSPDADRMYTFKFRKAVTPDGTEPLRFQDQTFPGKKGGNYTQSVIHFWFELAGNLYGKPTPYDGYGFRINVVNPFEGEISQIAADRWDAFVKLFCPHMNDWQWESDPEKSVYGVNEEENPLVVFVKEALKADKRVVALFKTNERGFAKMDMLDWSMSEADQVVDLDRKAVVETSQPVQLSTLVELIDDLCNEKSGGAAFKPTPKDSDVIVLDWTPEGLAWAKENLSVAWDTAKLPLFDGKRVLGKLSGGECAILEKVLRDTFGKKPVNAALTEEGSF